MDNTSMTFTSLALIVLLLIMCIMFTCHCLGPRASSWMRTNKEEKIGLSKNKLFHANGYMFKQIHSGSEFLLSTSGSFKRFDTIDKDDHNKSAEAQTAMTSNGVVATGIGIGTGNGNGTLQHANGAAATSNTTTTATTSTTPLWNLPQADVNIPPQPLRPAPAPNSAGPSKTVTFSFNQINELESPTTTTTTATTTIPLESQDSPTHYPRSCLRSPLRATALPQPLEAPPPPRLTSSSSVTLSATAIPRPIAKRQVSLQNGIGGNGNGNGHGHANVNGVHINGSGNGNSVGNNAVERRHPTLTRRNSSTNPFLCESVESLGAMSQTNTALDDTDTDGVQSITMLNGIASQSNSNPFHIATVNSSSNSTNVQHKNQTMPARQRSLSATEVDVDTTAPTTCNTNGSSSSTTATDLRQLSSRLMKLHQNTTNPFTGLTQRVKGPHMLQKTISEDYLFRKLGMNGHANAAGNGIGANGNATWSFGRSLLRQDSSSSLGRRNSSQCSLADSNLGSMDSISLERAISCDSVNSDSSVFQCELDQPYTQITGYLCVGLHYDKHTITNEGMELTVSVLEAKGLICPFNVESLDTFVRIYLVPDHAGGMQTKIFKCSTTPCYNETFNFWLKKQQGRHSLWFHLYHNGPAHTLIGEAEMEIGEMPRPITTWIPLSDSRKCNARWGELMFSLSYLPTAERLTIVVVKARNIKLELNNEDGHEESIKTTDHSNTQTVQSVFVKVYLMNNERKVLKKRTSLKRKDRSPIFNESMIFSVPPHSLTTVQLRLTVFGVVDSTIVPLGHVIAGSCAVGKGLRHWHQMLSSLRKPVAMWHVLRRATNQPIFTGGAEAVVAAMQSTMVLQRAKRNSIV